VVVELLVFVELPLVAEPPLVFEETVAVPLLAFWVLLFVTLTLFVVLTVTSSSLVTVAKLVEPWPVLLMLTLSLEPEPVVKVSDGEPAVTEVDEELLLLVAPLVAPPALVLLEVLAAPLVAPWLLVLLTVRPLLVVTLVSASLETLAWLFEAWPVVPMVTVAALAVRPKLRVAKPIAAWRRRVALLILSNSFH
jgi:hypothetical protein